MDIKNNGFGVCDKKVARVEERRLPLYVDIRRTETMRAFTLSVRVPVLLQYLRDHFSIEGHFLSINLFCAQAYKGSYGHAFKKRE